MEPARLLAGLGRRRPGPDAGCARTGDPAAENTFDRRADRLRPAPAPGRATSRSRSRAGPTPWSYWSTAATGSRAWTAPASTLLGESLSHHGYAVWNIDYRTHRRRRGRLAGHVRGRRHGIDHLAVMPPSAGLDLDPGGRHRPLGRRAPGPVVGGAGRPPGPARDAPPGTAPAGTALNVTRPVVTVQRGREPRRRARPGRRRLDHRGGQRRRAAPGRRRVARRITRTAVPERYAQASPHALLPLGVPQLLVHGSRDDRVPVQQCPGLRRGGHEGRGPGPSASRCRRATTATSRGPTGRRGRRSWRGSTSSPADTRLRRTLVCPPGAAHAGRAATAPRWPRLDRRSAAHRARGQPLGSLAQASTRETSSARSAATRSGVGCTGRSPRGRHPAEHERRTGSRGPRAKRPSVSGRSPTKTPVGADACPHEVDHRRVGLAGDHGRDPRRVGHRRQQRSPAGDHPVGRGVRGVVVGADEPGAGAHRRGRRGQRGVVERAGCSRPRRRRRRPRSTTWRRGPRAPRGRRARRSSSTVSPGCDQPAGGHRRGDHVVTGVDAEAGELGLDLGAGHGGVVGHEADGLAGVPQRGRRPRPHPVIGWSASHTTPSRSSIQAIGASWHGARRPAGGRPARRCGG